MKIPGKTRTLSWILKYIVVISAIIGTAVSAQAGSRTFMGGKVVFMYFTIQSNLAAAAICMFGAILLLRNRPVRRTWYVIKYVGTVSITLTGVVFCCILAPTMGRAAWNFQNVLTHVVVPAASIADLFVTGTCGTFKKRDVLFVVLPPMAYVVYAGIGYLLKWEFAAGRSYPYFFLNWGSPAGAFGFSRELPFMGCVWWILALLVLLILCGYLYLSILRALRKREEEPGTASGR